MKKPAGISDKQMKMAAYGVLSLAGVSPLVIAGIQLLDGWLF